MANGKVALYVTRITLWLECGRVYVPLAATSAFTRGEGDSRYCNFLLGGDLRLRLCSYFLVRLLVTVALVDGVPSLISHIARVFSATLES